MWTVLGTSCLCPGGRGRPAWPALTCGTMDRELCFLCLRLCLAPAGSPSILSALGAGGQSGWVWLQQSHWLLGEGGPRQFVAVVPAQLGSLPPAEEVPRGPRVVWSLRSSVRLRRGVVAPGPELGLCVPQAPAPPVLLVPPSPTKLVPVSLQPTFSLEDPADV